MTAHVDLVTDIGPAGVRTLAARRHLERCAECRGRVLAVRRLAELARRAGAEAGGAAGARGTSRSRSREGDLAGCLTADVIVALSRPGAPAPARDVTAHLASCEACALARDEARRALSGPRLAFARGTAPALPERLRARLGGLRPAPAAVLPLAAIPRDITRPAAPAQAPKSRRTAARNPRKPRRGR